MNDTPFAYNAGSRKRPEAILKELGLTPVVIAETVAGRRIVSIRVKDAKADRPKCLVCGFQVNAKNCKPVRPLKEARQSMVFGSLSTDYAVAEP